MTKLKKSYVLPLAIFCTFFFATNARAQDNESAEEECQSKNFRVEIDDATIKKMAIETQKVTMAPYTSKLSATGVLEIPVENVVEISSRAKGVVSSVKLKIGDEVTEEDVENKTPIAFINSKELGQAKSKYLSEFTELKLFKKQYEREKKLYEDKLATQKDFLDSELSYEQAKVEVLQAKQNLVLLGLTESAIEDVVKKNDLSPLLPIYAPFHGKIVEKKIAKGQVVDSDEALLKLANLERLNLILDIYEKDMTSIEIGQRVIMSSKAYTERKFRGKVSYISDVIDEKTRTLKVWVTVKNKSGNLKPGMFLDAEILVSDNDEMMRIPKSSLQNDGLSCCTLVFALEDSPKEGKHMVTTHKVEVGPEDKNSVQILAGLMPGQNIISGSAFLIKSELLKSSFGAG